MFHLLFLVSSVCIVVGFAGEIHFPRTLYRSHPLRGAYRAFSPGGNAVSFHIPGIMRNRGYIAAYSQKLDQGKTALFSHGASLLDLRFSDIPNSTGGTDITLRAGGGFGSTRR